MRNIEIVRFILLLYIVKKLTLLCFCLDNYGEEFDTDLWTRFKLVVDPTLQYSSSNESTIVTTETFGLLIRANNKTKSQRIENRWTKVEISPAPLKIRLNNNSSVVTTTENNIFTVSSIDTESSIDTATVPLKNIATSTPAATFPQLNSSINQRATPVGGFIIPTAPVKLHINSSLAKKTRQEDYVDIGYALLDDDDDDDDDEDDDDDDDDDNDDDEEFVDDGNSVVVHNDAIEETDDKVSAPGNPPGQDYNDYPESPHTVVLPKRKKKRRRKIGKKHGKVKIKHFKKLRKFILPLLLAYKLKFFTLVPLLLGGLVLMVATTGFAGFFFALFAVGLGLRRA